MAYYANAANQAKRKYTWMQSWVIVLGLLVPVVINIPASWGGDLNIDLPIKIAVTVMSLTLAILNGLLNFRKYGELWLSYRMTEELLKNEKYFFLTATGKYSDREAAFANFVATVEAIISSEHDKFRGLTEQVKQAATRDAVTPADKLE